MAEAPWNSLTWEGRKTRARAAAIAMRELSPDLRERLIASNPNVLDLRPMLKGHPR